MIPDTTPAKRPGYQTTEFWLSIVALAVAGGLAALGRPDAGDWLDFARWIVGPYVAARGAVKIAGAARGD